MLIIGELINTSRKAVNVAVCSGDASFIQHLAQEQIEAGADYIDVNCGTNVGREPEVMSWIVNVIQEKVKAPLCIDSPNPRALEAGLALCKFGQPMINSISDETDRYEQILPLALKYKAKLVALCMDSTGVPETALDRMRVVDSLYKKLTVAGVPEEDLYFDPLVKPISSVDKAGIEVLETIKLIKEKYPKVHFACGLSNISYGLPNRQILNRVFVAQTMALGMDGYILNPTDKGIMGEIYAGKALIGQDSYCMDYIRAHRRGLFQDSL
ncbi:MAG: methyltetrahydrofolate cobalamin methyltransferase [Dethiobacter sp.]|jgi:5-methyltetrahydrofolate--homocysteine methyltransferase|nr:methyltetrahydrofolate cobalamin methyltransferase [Dethiobacter sp.]